MKKKQKTKKIQHPKKTHNTNKIKVLIIEDNKLLREGMQVLLNKRSDMDAAAAFGDSNSNRLIEKVGKIKPEILLIDLGFVNFNSLKMVKMLKLKFPRLKIIGMGLLPVQSELKQYVEAGISAFVFKDAATEDFLKIIRDTARTGKTSALKIRNSLFSEIVENAVNELLYSSLMESLRMSDKEKIIVNLVSKGYSDKEIGKKLRLKEPAVKGHVDNILEKMSLSTRVQIAIYTNPGENHLNRSKLGQIILKT